MKNLDLRRQRKTYFVSVYFLGLNWERKKKFYSRRVLEKQYSTAQNAFLMHLWSWAIIMIDTIIISFLKLFFF